MIFLNGLGDAEYDFVQKMQALYPNDLDYANAVIRVTRRVNYNYDLSLSFDTVHRAIDVYRNGVLSGRHVEADWGLVQILNTDFVLRFPYTEMKPQMWEEIETGTSSTSGVAKSTVRRILYELYYIAYGSDGNAALFSKYIFPKGRRVGQDVPVPDVVMPSGGTPSGSSGSTKPATTSGGNSAGSQTTQTQQTQAATGGTSNLLVWGLAAAAVAALFMFKK